jgi:hypothetical protein
MIINRLSKVNHQQPVRGNIPVTGNYILLLKLYSIETAVGSIVKIKAENEIE